MASKKPTKIPPRKPPENPQRQLLEMLRPKTSVEIKTEADERYSEMLYRVHEQAEALQLSFREVMMSMAEPWLRGAKRKRRRGQALVCCGWRWTADHKK